MYQRYTAKQINTSELKNVLQAIWVDLSQSPINATILSFSERLPACIKKPMDISNMLSE